VYGIPAGLSSREDVVMKFLLRLIRHEEAATAVEYAVMLALIILVAIAAITNFGLQTSTVWNNNNQKLSNVHFGGS
jgi:pilus assembly protein Flp/PilA